MAPTHHRDWSFFYWAGVGFALAFGVVAILSIGGPFLLVGLVLFGFLLGRGTPWPACLGLLAGAGLVGVVIDAIGAVPSRGIWGGGGVALIAAGAASFWSLRCRRRDAA